MAEKVQDQLKDQQFDGEVTLVEQQDIEWTKTA